MFELLAQQIEDVDIVMICGRKMMKAILLLSCC